VGADEDPPPGGRAGGGEAADAQGAGSGGRVEPEEDDGDGDAENVDVGDDEEGADDGAEDEGEGHADEPVEEDHDEPEDGANGEASADEARDDGIHLVDELVGLVAFGARDELGGEVQDASPACGEEEEEETGQESGESQAEEAEDGAQREEGRLGAAGQGALAGGLGEVLGVVVDPGEGAVDEVVGLDLPACWGRAVVAGRRVFIGGGGAGRAGVGSLCRGCVRSRCIRAGIGCVGGRFLTAGGAGGVAGPEGDIAVGELAGVGAVLLHFRAEVGDAVAEPAPVGLQAAEGLAALFGGLGLNGCDEAGAVLGDAADEIGRLHRGEAQAQDGGNDDDQNEGGDDAADGERA